MRDGILPIGIFHRPCSFSGQYDSERRLRTAAGETRISLQRQMQNSPSLRKFDANSMAPIYFREPWTFSFVTDLPVGIGSSRLRTDRRGRLVEWWKERYGIRALGRGATPQIAEAQAGRGGAGIRNSFP